MSYTAFTAARPDVAAGGATRTSEIGYARSNDSALMDLLAQMSNGYWFNVSIAASTSDGPTDVRYTNGSQIVKKLITYGSGATAGLPVTVVLSKSTDSGATYSGIATITIAYSGSGDFVSTTWS